MAGTAIPATRSSLDLHPDAAASGGATLGPVSPEATDLSRRRRHDHDRQPVARHGLQFDREFDLTADATAGCGTVHVNGTVTQLTFDAGIKSTVVRRRRQHHRGRRGRLRGHLRSGRLDRAGELQPGRRHRARHRRPCAGVGDRFRRQRPRARARCRRPLTTAMIGYNVQVPSVLGGQPGRRVCGYIDFDHTGTSAPPQTLPAPPSPPARAMTLDVDRCRQTTAGLTYARLRAAYDATQAESPTGPASSGEVEDYPLSILPTVTITNSLPAGTAGTFDLREQHRARVDTADGASTGPATVGPAAPTLTAPSVAVSADISKGPLALTVSDRHRRPTRSATPTSSPIPAMLRWRVCA